MLSEPFRLRNDPPSISDHEAYRRWVIAQFEQRAREAREAGGAPPSGGKPEAGGEAIRPQALRAAGAASSD